MKRIAILLIAFVIPIVCGSLFDGCSSSSPTSEQNSSVSYNYQFEAANLPLLNSSFGKYVLWLRIFGDTTPVSVSLTNFQISNDSLVFTGTVGIPYGPDSIQSAIVSIEPASVSSSPSSPLMTGQWVSSSGSAILNPSDSGAIGNYSNAMGSAIFTTKLTDTSNISDTIRAKQEFYLMKFVNGVPVSSISNLPLAPTGWRYGLWVVDSSFYPLHQFFYGSFSNPNGPGSDSAKAEFPFPGGFNPAPLNDPGASLKVTLEPDFSVAANKPTGPSPITILWLQLQAFIYFDESIPFQNVWINSSPAGILRIWK